MDPTSLLRDPSYIVPPVPDASRGVAWLRSHVVRFSEGDDHRRRRAIVEAHLDRIDPSTLERSGDHVSTLAASLGLPRRVGKDVRAVAACYQPEKRITTAADAAVARLVDAAGGRWDEATANLICMLVQACDATAAMIAGSRPPVPTTVRIAPDGTTTRVPLDAIPFGAGRHACPARPHAEALERGARAFRDLHHGDEPLILPNAWDAASAALLVDAGFAAIGTTSLGVAAAVGVRDGSGKAQDETRRLVAAVVPLGVPVTVDIESGWGADLAELADELSDAGRALRYLDAGADGVFVPGLTDSAEIERFVATVAAPLNLLAHGDISRLRDFGVRRVSTGSLLYRTEQRLQALGVPAAPGPRRAVGRRRRGP